MKILGSLKKASITLLSSIAGFSLILSGCGADEGIIGKKAEESITQQLEKMGRLKKVYNSIELSHDTQTDGEDCFT